VHEIGDADGEFYIVIELIEGKPLSALLRDRVVTEQAQIRPHLNLFFGNEDVRYTGGLQTPIPDGAEIAIIPAICGGVLSALHRARHSRSSIHPTSPSPEYDPPGPPAIARSTEPGH
jgi:molybdopterin converting factor small subunit